MVIFNFDEFGPFLWWSFEFGRSAQDITNLRSGVLFLKERESNLESAVWKRCREGGYDRRLRYYQPFILSYWQYSYSPKRFRDGSRSEQAVKETAQTQGKSFFFISNLYKRQNFRTYFVYSHTFSYKIQITTVPTEPGPLVIEGLNGVKRSTVKRYKSNCQPSKMENFNCQPSSNPGKISRQRS